MKGIDIFCASQAATAVCQSMPEGSSSSSSSIQLGGGRAIDRFNPIIRDPGRISKQLIPAAEKPRTHQQKSRKSSAKAKSELKKKSPTIPNENAFVGRRKSWSCTRPGDFITPPGSSRYLLNDDQALLDVKLSDFDPILELVPVEANKAAAPAQKTDESSVTQPPSLCCSQNQVVVLRVSLHCKGCERKMRKHISRMQGVASFDIDFAAKKVTITGNVTPLEVLANVSKVKNAQLWAPTTFSSSAPPPNLNNSDPEIIMKFKEAGA